MFCVRKRNVSLNVSFTHQKRMEFDRRKLKIIFFGVVFFMSTSLEFELSILRNKTCSPYNFKFTRLDCFCSKVIL